MWEISKMEVSASRSRRMVPGPESNSNLELPICIRTEHELLFSDGTQVPEPKIVTFMPELFAVISDLIVSLGWPVEPVTS
jgi:hypothetical protein